MAAFEEPATVVAVIVLLCTVSIGFLAGQLASKSPKAQVSPGYVLARLLQRACPSRSCACHLNRTLTAVNGDAAVKGKSAQQTGGLGPEQLSALVSQRRSIFPKDFSGELVPRDMLDKLLDAANWAPTHNRTEPWRFVVLERAAQDRMIELTLQICDRELSPDKAEAKRSKLTRKQPDFAKVSHMIMICMKRQAVPGKLNPEWEELCAVACAVQNIYLMTTVLGLGGYWSSWTAEARDSAEFKKLLGLEAEDKCLGIFMLGCPGASAKGYRSARGPASGKVTWMV